MCLYDSVWTPLPVEKSWKGPAVLRSGDGRLGGGGGVELGNKCPWRPAAMWEVWSRWPNGAIRWKDVKRIWEGLMIVDDSIVDIVCYCVIRGSNMKTPVVSKVGSEGEWLSTPAPHDDRKLIRWPLKIWYVYLTENCLPGQPPENPLHVTSFRQPKKYRHEKKNSWYLINPKCSSKFHPNPFHCSFFIPFLHKPFGNTLETSKTPRLGDASRGGGGGTQRLSRKSREKSLRPGAPSCGGSKCPDSNGSAMLEYQGRGTICKGWTLLAILGICSCVSRELLGISYKTPPGPNPWKSQLRPFKSWRDGSGAGIRWI